MPRLVIRLIVALLCLGTILARKPLTATRALSFLEAGNARFVADKPVSKSLGEGVRRTLARVQNPLAIIVTCADTRVSPEHIFNAGLGGLFVIRNSGGVCDPETLASIEYAAEHLVGALAARSLSRLRGVRSGNHDNQPAADPHDGGAGDDRGSTGTALLAASIAAGLGQSRPDLSPQDGGQGLGESPGTRRPADPSLIHLDLHAEVGPGRAFRAHPHAKAIVES